MSSTKKKVLFAVVLTLTATFGGCVLQAKSLINSYEIEGISLLSHRSELIEDGWKGAAGSNTVAELSNGRTTVLVVFWGERVCSIEGRSLSIGSHTFATGEDASSIQSLLGNPSALLPSHLRQGSPGDLTTQGFVRRTFLGLPVLNVGIEYKGRKVRTYLLSLHLPEFFQPDV